MILTKDTLIEGKIIPKGIEIFIEKTKEDKKFAKVMSEWKAGTLKSSSGDIVKDKDQAIAIAYSVSGKE